MIKEDLLKKYKENVDKIRNEARKSGLHDEQITQILNNLFEELKAKRYAIKDNNLTFCANFRKNTIKISAILFLFLSIFVYVLLNVHTPTSSIVLRNVQGLTYPALKIVRILSVPFIKLFPSLTDLYDESCLVENPYFHVSEMECWPCENVLSIIDLTGIQELNTFQKIGEGTPFIAKINQNLVTLKNLQELYQNYSSELNTDKRRLKVTPSSIKSLNKLLGVNEHNLSSNIHIQWRINKMAAARIVRKLFPRPSFLPERSGQAVERFLTIDGPNAGPYELPNTECSYVFLIQGSGERTISLKPSNECNDKCRTVSIVMKPSYVLLYNWWYWRPVSLPVKNETSISISYMNSYC